MFFIFHRPYDAEKILLLTISRNVFLETLSRKKSVHWLLLYFNTILFESIMSLYTQESSSNEDNKKIKEAEKQESSVILVPGIDTLSSTGNTNTVIKSTTSSAPMVASESDKRKKGEHVDGESSNSDLPSYSVTSSVSVLEPYKNIEISSDNDSPYWPIGDLCAFKSIV